MPLARHLVAIVVLAGVGSTGSAAIPTVPPPSEATGTTAESDWPGFGRDPGRSNSSTAATGIDAGNVASLRRQQVRLDGTVDASPIYLRGVRVKGQLHDVFFVTTTYGKTVAIDANDGAILWEYTPQAYESWAGSYRITTATPVAGPSREFIYAASPDGHIQKLEVADGHLVWSTAITKLPEREKIAAALNFFEGRVIVATGGYIGDRPPYQGHVAILDGASGRLLHVWNALCGDRAELIEPRSCPASGAAIWGRSGAVVDAASGDIFVATGNGRWNGRTDWGDAAIELDRDATRLVGNYTPSNTEELDAGDRDLGSTSPALLGGGLIAQGGKDGRIRLLSVDRMRGSAAHRGGEVQSVSTPSGGDLFTAPAVLHDKTGTWLFAADNGGTAAWALQSGRLEQKWQNSRAGTSPVIAGGLLYVYDPSGGLRVYRPDTGHQIATLDCGEGHWNSPIVVDGKIALPEGNANAHRTSGVLDIWRLLQAPLVDRR